MWSVTLYAYKADKKLYNRKKKEPLLFFYFCDTFEFSFLCFGTIKSQKTTASKRGKKRKTVKKYYKKGKAHTHTEKKPLVQRGK